MIETGLGGRLDATNVVPRTCAVITTIALDHAQYLGTTQEAIAREKFGIVREGQPVISGIIQPELLDILRTDYAPDLMVYQRAVHCLSLAKQGKGFVCDVSIADNSYKALFFPVETSWQVDMMIVGMWAACHVLAAPDSGHIRAALARFYWPGRMEKITFSGKTLLLDGAHNVVAIDALCVHIATLPEKPVILVGILSTKEWRYMIQHIARQAACLVLYDGFHDEAMPAESLKDAAQAYCDEIVISDTLANALNVVVKYPCQTVCICGSLYLIGAFKAMGNL